MAQSIQRSSETRLYLAQQATAEQIRLKEWLQQQLAPAGITLNGPNPWDPQIHNPQFYTCLFRQGSLGAGESYVDGWWDCSELDELINRIMSLKFDKRLQTKWVYIKHMAAAKLLNLQSAKRAWQVGKAHYDVGNDLYRAMLDETMAYSCGYWQHADELHQAQIDKLELICNKLKLTPADRVLDIGCGWGSFAEYAARHYGISVSGVTISKEQQKLAQERCQHLPVNILLQDYRSVKGQFNKLVSIGMFEHVGLKNFDTFMETAYKVMKNDGIFVLHTIGSVSSHTGTDPWIHKYIFPNGFIPSLTQISQSCEPYFVIEDVHNFGPDYDRTLIAWHGRFDEAWNDLKKRYDDRFYRMWSYYLKSCAGAFRSRNLQLFQLVLRKRGTSLPRYSCR